MFTDTHCHIHSEYYDNIPETLNKSVIKGVDRWINNGCDSKSNKEVISLINRYKNMYGAIGIHPESVTNYKASDIQFIKDNIVNKKVIGIGEIGLDYHYMNDNKKEQIELLETQLKIAEENNLPVIIHCREAASDMLNILKKYRVKGVIHSFTENLDIAREFINMGYLLGVNGMITFEKNNLKDVIKEIPLEFLLLETDAPYLTPVPYRGTKNNPGYVYDIAKFLADLKDVSINTILKITNENANKLFHI